MALERSSCCAGSIEYQGSLLLTIQWVDALYELINDVDESRTFRVHCPTVIQHVTTTVCHNYSAKVLQNAYSACHYYSAIVCTIISVFPFSIQYYILLL